MPRVEQSAVAPRQTTETYDKGRHADAMNDLIAMAFECDVTRVISYMLEDERSEFTYDNVQERAFTADGSRRRVARAPNTTSPSTTAATCSPPSPGGTSARWRDLCRKLDAIEEAPGISVLDNCVVFLGACMHGGNHEGDRLPVALLGGGNLGLENDQHIVLDKRPLRDLYFTLMNDVYGLAARDFGQNLTGAPPARITELLKG